MITIDQDQSTPILSMNDVRLSDVPRQLIYGIMVYVRQTIVSDASWALSRAVCIVVRYSAVRRQFGSHDGGLEIQVNTSFTWMRFFQYFFVALRRMGMEYAYLCFLSS